MKKTFKALSALLSYPDEELQKAAPELRSVIDEENLIPADNRRLLDPLIEEIATGDLYALQERYIELFDRTRSLSLHLFEHVYGESRDRGQAMIDLKSLYEQAGLYLSTSELPDYLPAFLEFLSIRPLEEARAQLSQPAHLLTAIAKRLHKRHSPYAAVFEALTTIALRAPEVEVVAEGEDADPNDFAALDAQWEEEAVTFGPGAVPSCKDRIVSQIRAGRRPAAGAPKGVAP
ncbi:MAG: nitrate reductase molybdenum cofactor assembly chaperone [Methyloceanibacter sp.]|jgi:nitrate reductase delta subunit|nr:nitrate reductase molybdenum cofactor assembly chaperone [Methyloceanibacter sp.]